MSVPSHAANVVDWRPSKGAYLAVKTAGKTLDRLTSKAQLPVEQTALAANQLGLQPGTESYTRSQLRHAGHFAILSIQLKFETNAALALAVKWNDLSGYDTDKTTLEMLRLRMIAGLPKQSGHRGNLQKNHIRGIIEWDRRVAEEGLNLLRQANEPWMSYRARLMQSFMVGAKVASFIALLLYPTHSELVTIDTWMCEVLSYVKRRATDSPTVRQYDALQAKLDAKRIELGMAQYPLGLFQWMVWDWSQGDTVNTWKHHSHAEAALV